MVGVAALSLALSATGAFAQDSITKVEIDGYGAVPVFIDGRLNAFDMAAPVVIFYTDTVVQDEDGNNIDVVNGIEFWAVDGETESEKLVLYVSLDEIAELTAGEIDAIEVNGYSLTYVNGYFQASDAATGYTFSWENVSIPVSA